ncbi:DUF3967 domain-containing protein [Streptomyces virginiae]|uniref:DUF3967 domain-containing protein n=5 Tax=Bacteria TaxID=2 RepID=UPI0035D7159D
MWGEKVRKWFTISEADKETGIPHQTLRRYLNNHVHHLIIKKKHKSYLIAEESLQILLKIRELYSEGKTIEDVENALTEQGIPMNITVNDDENEVSINIGETLIHLQKDMREQKEFNEKLLEVLQAQNEQIKKHQEYIEQKLEVRDQKLLESLKESMEVRKQIAASKEQTKKWWKFWK